MFEFLNPGFLLAGSTLVSLPIVIHLINRMRFRRVRWAAMEFLLKSQKRNRRRLILEQLLLLALRCLLVLLTVLLVSRYLLAFFQPQNTLHVVVLDDSLSMTDHWKQDGEGMDSFKFGRQLIVDEIARNAVQARTAQRFVLLHASDPGRLRFDQRLNEQSITDLQKGLADADATALRVDLLRSVEAATALFDRNALDKRVLHLVSDFRQRDWGDTEAAGLARSLEALGQAGVKVNLIDAAHPVRSEAQNVAPYHDNLGVVDLRAQTRVAAKDMPVQFAVTVGNFGVSERKNVRVTVKVNGGERSDASLTLLSVPPGLTTQTFQASFDQLGPNQITANLENEEAGLTADNTRYAVVEVRKQVPILVVDGSGGSGQKPGGDTYHVEKVFSSARSYQVVPRGTSELERPDLDQYPSIFLLNVRELSDRAQKNLEDYVRDGGSVAFFLGDRVNAEHYTKRLYADGKGIFPAPLADRPYPGLSDPALEPNLLDNQYKVFLRDDNHPLVAKLAPPKVRTLLKFLSIKRYYPVPRAKWAPEPGRVEEVVTLPNQRAVQDYAGEVQEVLDSLARVAQEPKLAKYRPLLEGHMRAIRETLTDRPLYELANALDALLHDRGDPNDPERPNLAELWEQPEARGLRNRLSRLQQTVQLGDPLVIAARHGRGRVVAFLTTAGQAWNDWGGGPASVLYPVLLVELQHYLTGAGAEAELTVGTPLEIQLDATRYDPKMHRFFRPEAQEAGPARGDGARDAGPVDLKEQVGAVTGGRLTFLFDEARRPGLYLFDLTRRVEEGAVAGPVRTEQRAYVFNVDPAEGDLRRAARDDLEKLAAQARLRVPGTGWGAELADRRSDLSESAWFYLLFLLVLIAEQALAVHLSFHLKGQEGSAAVQPAASAA